MTIRRSLPLVLTGLLCLGMNEPARAQNARVDLAGDSLAVSPNQPTRSIQVRVSGPGGLILDRSFAHGESAVLALVGHDGAALPDGAYVYEVTLAPAGARDRPVKRPASDVGGGGQPTAEGGQVQSGSFRMLGGRLLASGAPESRAARVKPVGSGPSATEDFVIADDLIVQGSACVGFDCVNNESFGFDTIRLKENNTRIKFEDTSTGTFPTHDWQITANDSANGGAEKFSIEDITASTVPLTVTGSAPSNAIFVDSTGRVGFRTATPVLDLHVNTSNTPAFRMEQNNSGGFTAQTWDVAGNEANFFVRDVTGGSRLPLRIRPGAPTSSLDIAASGNVGVGTQSPGASLHVKRVDGSTSLKVEEASTTSASRTLLQLTNMGNPSIGFTNSSSAASWFAGMFAGSREATSFALRTSASGGSQLSLDTAGNLSITGALAQNSDRNVKDGVAPVDPAAILGHVLALPISTWHYTADDAQTRHLGPMAQDFKAAFGLGEDERHIAPADMSGVALAAIKALNEALLARDAQIKALEARIQALEAARQ